MKFVWLRLIPYAIILCFLYNLNIEYYNIITSTWPTDSILVFFPTLSTWLRKEPNTMTSESTKRQHNFRGKNCISKWGKNLNLRTELNLKVLKRQIKGQRGLSDSIIWRKNTDRSLNPFIDKVSLYEALCQFYVKRKADEIKYKIV